MAFLITPIDVGGVLRCCDPVTRRTAETLVGDARWDAVAGEWVLLEAQGASPNYTTARVYEGSVQFGVCCGTQITFGISGQIETKDTNFDWLRITVDGVEQYYRASQEPAGDPDDPADVESIIEDPLVVPLLERPCGHIILIESSTGDANANNNIWWRVSALIG